MLQLSLLTAGTGDVPCLEASLGSELQGSCWRSLTCSERSVARPAAPARAQPERDERHRLLQRVCLYGNGNSGAIVRRPATVGVSVRSGVWRQRVAIARKAPLSRKSFKITPRESILTFR